MNKGFTLVELLAVVVILAIIATITTVMVGDTIANSKSSLSDTQKNTIERSAKEYYLKEGVDLADGESTCVTLEYLIQKGYIESAAVKDPSNNTIMTGSVEISYSANQYTYKYKARSCPVTVQTAEVAS